jgi:hypothetical protein
MIKHSVTLTDIIIEEHALSLKAGERYGDVFANTLDVFNLIENFFAGYIGNYDEGADLFIKFYTALRNFYLLSLFSTVRLHQVQASMDLRQFIESGINAAYSLANPKYKDFAKTDEFGLLKSTKKLKKKRNNWIDKKYSKTSADIKRIKKLVEFSTHSNLVDTYRNSKHLYRNVGKAKTITSYFDFEDPYFISVGLWQLANTALAVLGLIYEVNRDYKKLLLVEKFTERHANIMIRNQQIKQAVMKTKRFQRGNKERENFEKGMRDKK